MGRRRVTRMQNVASSIRKTREWKRKTNHEDKISNMVMKVGGIVDAPNFKGVKRAHPEAKTVESFQIRSARNVQDAPEKINKKKVSAPFNDLLETRLLIGQKVGYALGGKSRKTKIFELEGVIGRDGIQCPCAICKMGKISTISPSRFENHAGYKCRRKPFENIYLMSSLKRLRDVLLAVENCHPDNLEEVIRDVIAPRDSSSNQTVDNIHGGHENTKNVFNQCKTRLCDQCEREYHVDHVTKKEMYALKDMPKDDSYCTNRCWDINYALHNQILEGEQQLPEGFRNNHGPNITWRLFKGEMDASGASKKLINDVVRVFRNRFDPIVDQESNHDLFHLMVSGKKSRDQDYHGMYCAILMDSCKLVSAAVFRVFGEEVVELPLVATIRSKERQGYFHALLMCIEDVLLSLKVKSMVLPSAHVTKSMWMDRFGFQKLKKEQIDHYKSNYQNLQLFDGTTLLHKSLVVGEASKS